jgi:hypothetical protein
MVNVSCLSFPVSCPENVENYASDCRVSSLKNLEFARISLEKFHNLPTGRAQTRNSLFELEYPKNEVGAVSVVRMRIDTEDQNQGIP